MTTSLEPAIAAGREKLKGENLAKNEATMAKIAVIAMRTGTEKGDVGD